MHKYSVYILKCADSTLYTGITNELYRRLDEHENGRNPQCYTFNRRPAQLVFHQDFHFVQQAIAFEKQVKGWSRKKKEALIAGEIDLLKILATCTNESHHSNKKGI
jgi:putative endonuclease